MVRRPASKSVKRLPSLADVAKLAGVSKMTVSRVVNRDPRVSPETVAAVTKAQAKIGFVPKSSEVDGRRLRSRSRVGLHQGRIATLIPDANLIAMQTALTGRLLIGIDRTIHANRLQQVVTRLPEAHALPHFFNRRQLDGVIIRDGYDSQWIIDQLRELDIPSVWLFASGPTLAKDAVINDNAHAAQLAFTRLCQRGSQRFVIMDDHAEHPAHRQRTSAFIQLAVEAGLPCHRTVVTKATMPDWTRQTIQAIGSDKKPVGVFIPGTYDIAQAGVLAVANRRSIGIQADLVTCSFDPHLIDIAPCPMANVEMHPENMGEAAVELLLWRLADPHSPCRHTVIQPSLVTSAET